MPGKAGAAPSGHWDTSSVGSVGHRAGGSRSVFMGSALGMGLEKGLSCGCCHLCHPWDDQGAQPGSVNGRGTFAAPMGELHFVSFSV